MKVTIEVDQADQVLLLFPILAAIQRDGTIFSETVVGALDRCRESIASGLDAPQVAEPVTEAKPAVEEPKPKKTRKKAEAPAEIPEDVKAEAPSLDDIRKAISDIPDEQKKTEVRERAKEYLKKVGKEKITDLDESERAAFMVELSLSV